MGFEDNIRFFAATDVGRVRDHNEDNYLVDKKLALFVVADGMGGHAAGEVASAIAVRTVHDEVKKERQLIEDYQADKSGAGRVTAKDILHLLEFAVQRACARVHEEAQNDQQKRGMGTTLSSLLIVGNKGFIAHVGDSRIYMMREEKVQQLTEDHTVYNELIKRGKLTREQIEKVAHKNAITRAVGVYERVEVDTLLLDLLHGDKFLLASDGLHGYLASADDLSVYLSELDGEQSVQKLIAFANDLGGKDNITGIVIRLGEGTLADSERAAKLAQKREVLAKMPLFSRLSEREMLRIMQVAEVRAYAPGEQVIKEGDRGDELFIVLSGIVRVLRGEAVLTTLGAGEHFGEMALIRSVPRSASVHAEGDCELIAIRRGDFFEILRKEHGLAVKLLWQFLGVLADRLDSTSNNLRVARAELQAEDVTSEIFPLLSDDDEEPTDRYAAGRYRNVTESGRSPP
jgi:serine/threonine protein phosphatase PrpC/CRP-like cAMP-binding protein